MELVSVKVHGLSKLVSFRLGSAFLLLIEVMRCGSEGTARYARRVLFLHTARRALAAVASHCARWRGAAEKGNFGGRFHKCRRPPGPCFPPAIGLFLAGGVGPALCYFWHRESGQGKNSGEDPKLEILKRIYQSSRRVSQKSQQSFKCVSLWFQIGFTPVLGLSQGVPGRPRRVSAVPAVLPCSQLLHVTGPSSWAARPICSHGERRWATKEIDAVPATAQRPPLSQISPGLRRASAVGDTAARRPRLVAVT